VSDLRDLLLADTKFRQNVIYGRFKIQHFSPILATVSGYVAEAQDSQCLNFENILFTIVTEQATDLMK